MDRIGHRIRSIRERQRRTQADVADAAGIDRSHYAAIERGEADPRFQTLAALSIGLRVPLANIVEGNTMTDRIHDRTSPQLNPNDQVLAASLSMSCGLQSPERFYSPQTLEAASRQYRGGIRLGELLEVAARTNTGQRLSASRDTQAVLRAAFPPGDIRAGWSTIDLGGILTAVANKSALSGFMAVEQSWREIAAIVPASNFQQMTRYRMTGGFEFEMVGPGGELPHAAAGNESYTNKVESFGKMFSITRQDIVNDSLDVLRDIPARIGRGGALKLNSVLWGAFNDNASFFTAGRGNLLTGAGSVLGSAGLQAGYLAFNSLTDADGTPLGLKPEILLVPRALDFTARRWMSETEIRDTTANTKYPTANVFAGMSRVVTSTYLGTAAGGSDSAWYLLADPAILAAVEVAFLNGVQSPTVESAQADFSTLGVQFRGYFDFGVALSEYRAGVKSAGA